MSRRRKGVGGGSLSLKSRQGARRRSKPLPEGQFDASIVDLSDDGYGVARIDGKVCFINDGLPGEKLRFRYTHVAKQLDQGQATEILQASPDRAHPPCPHFGVCGGCTLQHMAPAAQIARKQIQLVETLRRVGNLEVPEIAPPILGAQTGYRRRARLGVRYAAEEDRALIGFRERASSKLARIQHCEVLDPRVGSKLVEMGKMIATLSIRREIPQIEIACAERVALVFRVVEKPSNEDCLTLSQFAGEHGFVVYLQPGGPDTIHALTPPAPVLRYSPDGSDTQLCFEPTDFIQINEGVSQRAVLRALDWLKINQGDRVLELFSGLGNFSIPLAQRGARVTAIEGEASLVARARKNAADNGVEIEFYASDLFIPSPDVRWIQEKYDAVLLDPPRAGAEAMMPYVAACQPKRIVYVSCHPATLARDAGLLVNDHGYRLVRAGVMDMFTHTAHVESMALFERVSR